MQLEFTKDQYLLGSGNWYADNDGMGAFAYTGLWSGGRVVALLVGKDEEEVVATGSTITCVVNMHAHLVRALRLAREALLFSAPLASNYPEPIARHRAAYEAVCNALDAQ